MELDRGIVKIKMKHGYLDSQKLTDIQEMYCEGRQVTPPGWYPVKVYWDHLLEGPWKIVQVDIYPYPALVPRITPDGEIYICTNIEKDADHDFLLDLPREEAEA